MATGRTVGAHQARGLNLLGYPMPRRVGWVDPFQQKCAFVAAGAPNGLPLLLTADQHAFSTRGKANRFGEFHEVLANAFEALAVERDDLGAHR